MVGLGLCVTEQDSSIALKMSESSTRTLGCSPTPDVIVITVVKLKNVKDKT